MEFCLVQDFPCPASIAPFIDIITRDVTLNGIYRGDDAKHLLNPRGHYTQDQIFKATPEQAAEWGVIKGLNPSGESTHELRSDGLAYPDIPRGEPLEEWRVGFGVQPGETDLVIETAKMYGWEVFVPYPGFHHLNFAKCPQPYTEAMMERIVNLRRSLPRS